MVSASAASAAATDLARAGRWDRPLAVLLLGGWLGLVALATFVDRGATRIYTWPWAFYTQLALLAPWAWAAWQLGRGRAPEPRAALAAAALAGALLVAVAASAYRHAAFEGALPLLAPLGALPWVAAAWRDAAAAQRLAAARVLGAVLGAFCLWSVFGWFAAHGGSLAFATRNPFPLGHWNHTGGMALLALPLCAALVAVDRRAWRIGWGVASALALATLFSSGSRGAALGLAAAVVAGALAVAVARGWSARRIGLAVVVAALLAAAAVAANPRLRGYLVDPGAALALAEGDRQRLGFLLTGAAIARAHPWTGIGPATVAYWYPEYRVDLPGALENSFQLHNGPLQWWVDTGVVGTGALLFCLALLAAAAGRTRRHASPFAQAAVAALVGYGVLWLTDHQLDVPVYPTLLALAAAVVWGEAARRATAAPPRWMAAVPSVGVLAAFVVLAPHWQARAAFAAAWEARDRGDIAAFVDQLRAAARAAPGYPIYANHLGHELAQLAEHAPPEDAASLHAEARAAWQHSLAIHPRQDYPHLNLGWLALAAGDGAAARAHFAAAARVQPHRTALWWGTAIAALLEGATEEAIAALARELRHSPRFVTSPVWREEPWATLAPGVLAALRQDPADRELAALAAWWWLGSPMPPLDLDRAPRALRWAAAPEADPPPAGVAPELAAAWRAHVAATPGASLGERLRTLPGTVAQRIRHASLGQLYRQLDGPPPMDLGELTFSPVAPWLEPLYPMPRYDDRGPRRSTRLNPATR